MRLKSIYDAQSMAGGPGNLRNTSRTWAIGWKVIATGPGHGIQLTSGRLVVPIWLAYGNTAGYHTMLVGKIDCVKVGNPFAFTNLTTTPPPHP